MPKIDLLKGQGVPIKSSPGGALVLAMVLAIPILATMALTTEYLDGRIKLTTLRTDWSEIEGKISQLSAGVKFQESDYSKINSINACFVEVQEVLQHHVQWTPVFVALIENLPKELFLEKLRADTLSEVIEVPSREDPTVFITVDVPRSIMFIELYSHLNDHDSKNVMNYIETLNNLKGLKERVESIRLLSQVTDKQGEIVRYSIKCVYKPYTGDLPL